MSIGTSAAVLVVLVLAAAVLAAAETSLTHLRAARARALAEEGHRAADTLLYLVEHRDRVLNPILLLQVACHLATGTIVGTVAEREWGSSSVLPSLAVTVLVVFVVAVAIPKTWALQHTDRAGLAVAPLVRALTRVPPLRWLTGLLVVVSNVLLPGKGREAGPTLREEELLKLAEQAVENQAIEIGEQELIESVIEFGDTIVREVMVPRTDMVTVPADLHVGDAIEVVILNGFSRLPAYGEGIDDIVGLVYAKDLLRAERDGHADDGVTAILRKAHFVPESKRVTEMLAEMRAEKFHQAIVVDEYGGTAGLVTLEDLLEELVGDIHDEYDREEASIEHLAGGAVRVTARLAIDEVNELLDAHLPEGDWDSIGGLMFHLLGHVPIEGETVTADGWQLRAEAVKGRRIGLVRLIPAPGAKPPENATP